jgi:hypothetical protein
VALLLLATPAWGRAAAKKPAAAAQPAVAPPTAAAPAARTPVPEDRTPATVPSAASTSVQVSRTPAAAESTLVGGLLGFADSTNVPLRDMRYFYSSFGAPDPFRPLVGGEFEPYDGLVDLHTAKLVGVLWRGREYVAIVQDMQGFGYNLRPGDPVRNGSVVSVTATELVGQLNIYGQTDRVTLRLEREE